MRGRASVEVVPKGASLSQSVITRVRFMHCRFLVQLKIVQYVSKDRADDYLQYLLLSSSI